MSETIDFGSMSHDQLQIQSLVGQIAQMSQRHAMEIAHRDARLLYCDLEIKRLREDIEAFRNQIPALPIEKERLGCQKV